jgi:hypothetical protein
MTFELNSLTLTLLEEGNKVRVRTDGTSALLAEQTVDQVKNIIQRNFTMVNAFYRNRVASHPGSGISLEDLDRISIFLVIRYLYMYNHWRIQYRRPKYENLDFKNEDFDFPTTDDKIFRYFEKEYPADWKAKCCVLLNMDLAKLESYYEERQKFANK